MAQSSPRTRTAGQIASVIRPPWSTQASVLAECTSCGDCLRACPEGILIKGRAGTPVVAFQSGICTFCRKCADACEEAVFAPADQPAWDYVAAIGDACLLHRNVSCQSCTDACDEGALRMEYRAGRVGAIAVEAALCTGCGGCLGVCPVSAIALVDGPAEDAA